MTPKSYILGKQPRQERVADERGVATCWLDADRAKYDQDAIPAALGNVEHWAEDVIERIHHKAEGAPPSAVFILSGR